MKNIIKQILLFAFIFGFLITPNYSYAQEGNDRDINLYRKNIEWKKGSPIFWTISDWAVVCLNADAPAPVNVGENKNIKFTDLSKIYDQTLLKILYYGYGGPNEWIELSKTLNSEMTTANDGTKILQFETFDGNTKTSISGEDAAYHRTHLYISNYYSPKFTPEFSDRIYLAKEYKDFLNFLEGQPNPPSNFEAYILPSSNGKEQNMAFWRIIKKHNFSITKSVKNLKLELSNYLLSNAEYAIYKSESDAKLNKNQLNILKTNQYGKTDSLELDSGIYYVKEIKSPKGFKLDEKIYTVNLENESSNLEVLEEYQKAKFSITKLDSETNKGLKGVVFSLMKDNQEIKKLTTLDGGKVESGDLDFGTYTLREINVPKGYTQLPGDITIVIDGDESGNEYSTNIKVSGEKQTLKGTDIEISNHSQKGKLILEKKAKVLNGISKDEQTGITKLEFTDTFLEGTTWNLIANEDIMSYDTVTKLHNKGDVVSTIKTNDKEAVKVKDIALGKYILKEVSVPKQYVLDTREYEIEFTPQQQEVKVHSITQRKYNERKSINFEFTKKFEDTKLFTLNPKAEFGLFVLEDYTENGVTVAKDTMVSKTSVLAKETNDKEFVVKGTFENIPIDAKYYIKELNVDKNYIIDENKYELEEFDFANTKTKENTVTNKAIIENKLQKISLKVSKTEMGSDKSITVEGAKYRLVAVDKVKGENVVGEYITDKNGKIEIVDLPNAGKYYLEEVESPKGYFKNEEKVNVDPINTKHGETLEVEVEDEKIPSIETTAVDNETDKKESLPLEEVIIKDKVMYYDLIIGKTYIVDGTLMYKLTNKPVLVNGKEVKASKEFIPTSRNGFVELLFTVPGNVVRGKETVVFEDLYKDGKLLTFHRDIHDKAQTTRTTNPRIKTTLMEVKTGAKEFLPLDKLIHLVDRIEYFDLVPGIKMRFDLVLMNSVTKEVLKDANGKELTASLEFTPETKDGVAEVFITVNAKDLRGISLVAFETLSDISVEGKVRKVAEHKDFNDKGQTVDILNKPENPETGDSGVAIFGAMTIISTLGLIFTFITIKNKKALD